MTYILIEDRNSTELIKKINALLVAGWELAGGVAFNADQKLYLQAMIIRERV